MARDQALDAIWPDASPQAALTGLYTALHALRVTLEPGLETGRGSRYVEVRGGTLALANLDGTYVDIDAFREAIARAELTEGADRADALRQAIGIYAGDFLVDEPYADWPVPIRERLRRDWRRAVLDLAEIEAAAQRPLAGVAPLERVIEADPTDEPAHRALMRALAEGGRRADALSHFARLTTILRSELDAEPSDETEALARTIADAPPKAPTIAPPTVSRVAAPPAPVTPLIGRVRDVAALRELLADRGERLVTIVGPPGIGKTRLALEVARLVPDELGWPAVFVSLATIRDPTLVLPTIARSFGIDDAAGRPAADQLRDTVYDRQLLLVLDNFEQVMEAAPQIAALVEANAGLRVIVTSREALDVRAERRYPVAPLPLPPLEARDGRLPPAEVAALESVALFLDRVKAAVPTFELTEANAPVIAEICVRLEGLPLAIELAAVHCRHITPAGLLARLGRRLPLLAGGARDLPDRLRTMRAAIAWSYELLNPSEQRLFRRLAVFSGGCTTDSVESFVARLEASEGDSLPAEATPDLVASLHEKSMLTVAPGGEPRLVMYETIREFAAEQLASAGEDAPVRDAHAMLYLDMAERAAPMLTGAQQGAWLERLEREHDNMRAALTTLLANRDADRALRLCRALSRFWRMHGHYTEARRVLARALAAPVSSGVARARALVTAGDLAEGQGDYASAESSYLEALAGSTAGGDSVGIGEASLGLGAVAAARSELPVAVEWIEQALRTFRQAGEQRAAASAVNYLATIAFKRGDFDRAASLWEECLDLLTALGDDRARSIALSNLGVLELQRGNPEKAAENHRSALVITRQLGDKWGTTHPLINLGRVLISLGRPGEARPLLEEAVANSRLLADEAREALSLHVLALALLAEGAEDRAGELIWTSLGMASRAGDRLLAVDGLEVAASILARRSDEATAARLLGAAEATRATIGTTREAVDQAGFEAVLSRIEHRLSQPEVAALWSAGRADDLQTAIDAAVRALRDTAHVSKRLTGSPATG
jgi:predicted ATPase/DNA-binding SARP family transcriptional activator/Tfp pilus assembly protein PilF